MKIVPAFPLTCRLISVALAELFNGRRGHVIRTSARQNGTGFQGNGLGLEHEHIHLLVHKISSGLIIGDSRPTLGVATPAVQPKAERAGRTGNGWPQKGAAGAKEKRKAEI